MQRLSHLPILVDPSHGTGKRNKVTPLTRAAVAVGADGLIIEVHDHPDQALSDGGQSLYPDQFDELMAQVRQIAPVQVPDVPGLAHFPHPAAAVTHPGITAQAKHRAVFPEHASTASVLSHPANCAVVSRAQNIFYLPRFRMRRCK